MKQISPKTVLVFGASSGIGLACAKLLVEHGCTVYGVCRREMSGQGIHWLTADVTDEAAVQRAVDAVIRQTGGPDIVIQSAGVGIAGAVEDLSDGEIAAQMGPNFYGTVHVLRAVLPIMRTRRRGIFIQIGSIAGLLSIPYQGYYSASKYALEALIEALRMEVRPHGITACLVEPGDTKTAFTGNRVFCAHPKEDYQQAMRHAVDVMERDELKGVLPEKVAKVVLQVIKRRRPPVRIAVGLDYKLILLLKRLLPAAVIEWMLYKKYLGGGKGRDESV